MTRYKHKQCGGADDYVRYRRKRKEEKRRTVREFDNATFTSDYLNIGKLFCSQLLIVGNFAFACNVLLFWTTPLS